MEKKFSVLAIGAHPDDLELLCGGTLAKFSKNGHKVFMYHACTGDKGDLHKTSEEIKKIRAKEAVNAARIIGAESFGGDFDDFDIAVNLENRLFIVDVIRKCSPDLIFTHHPNDYLTDHINLSRLVMEACNIVASPKLITNYEASKSGIPRLFYIDTFSGIGFNPIEYVDISNYINLKISAMKEHASQLIFVKEATNEDLLEMINISGRYRGFQCGVDYAEGFIESLAWPRKSVTRILP